MKQSLTSRLFLSAGMVIFLFLAVTALVLDQAFTISLENIVREKLRLHTYSLLEVADYEGGLMRLPGRMPEQRFNTRNESLIGIVTDRKEREYWRSVSADKQRFSLPSPEAGEWLFGRAQDSLGKSYFVSSYSTIWSDSGRKSTFVFTVMEDVNYYQGDLKGHRYTILLSLFAVGLVLIGLQAIILRWGLRPVRGLASAVDAMGRGESESLGGDYPRELQPLVSNVNLLIENERRQREKYRDRMADLSHSLKTPLSVLKGLELDIAESADAMEVDRQSLVARLGQQIEKMNSIVDYQLRRAVSSGQNISLSAIPLLPEIETLLGALDKVYTEKQIISELQVASDIVVFADEGDLAELLGNILDNAYKNCERRVMTRAENLMLENGKPGVRIAIEDDGPGVPKAKRSSVLKRGVRLDTTRAGQGFGLAIVADIVSTYGGTIAITDSVLGGALFTLELPTR